MLLLPQANTDAKKLGVTVVEQFKVNEYEIMILAATESDGLETWLTQRGYSYQQVLAKFLQPYIRQKMKFFVAKVDLKEFDKSGDGFLRPLQISYRSPKFMLQIRLGMLNAQGDQDLIAYLLSPQGQVQVTLITARSRCPRVTRFPNRVKNDFGKFYKAASKHPTNGKIKKSLSWNMPGIRVTAILAPAHHQLMRN